LFRRDEEVEYGAIMPRLVEPAINVERYLARHHPERQMYIVTLMKKPG